MSVIYKSTGFFLYVCGLSWALTAGMKGLIPNMLPGGIPVGTFPLTFNFVLLYGKETQE